MKKVILDTNFLMSILQLKIDIFEGIFNCLMENVEYYIIDKTKNELEKLIKTSKLSDSQAAKFGLKVLESKPIKVIKTTENKCVDDLILDQTGYVVATVDKELKQKLKNKKIRILTIKQKKYIVLE
jgi:rRNA-processing protein FCF1